MGEIDLRSTPDERIVAVFRDRDTARMAADRARRSGGKDVAVEDRNDDTRALIGEMREETAESWAGPSIAIYTPEMARHIPGPTAAAAAIGAVLALPLAFLVGGNVSVMGRVILAMVCGAIAGGTIGFLAGGFLGARRRTVLDLAEERGVVVGVRGGNPAAIRALATAGPIRIDRLHNAFPVETVASHEDRTPSETTKDQPIPDEDEP
jgi:hypothetical protein